MKPPPFRYLAPTTVDECVAHLSEHGVEAKLLAGGQSLVPLMNLRLAAPEVLVDLNRVNELAYVDEDGDQLSIGAMTRHRDVAGSPLVRKACPMLADAVALIGHAAIRNRGTIGGSLAHADPAAEIPCVAATLDAELVAIGPGGRRTLSAPDFFVGHFTTVLDPDELLLEIRLRRTPRGTGARFEELSRKSGDFALVAVAVDLQLRGGRVERARIGVGGAGERPWRAGDAERALTSAEPTADRLEEAAAHAAEEANAHGHGDDGHRRHVIATLTRRALTDAATKADEAP